MATYPSAIWSPTAPSVSDNLSIASHWTTPTAETVAIQNELGISPSGGYSTVKERLDSTPNANLLINSKMEIDQRNGGSATAISTAQFLTDGFKWRLSGAGTVDYSKSTTVPSDGKTNYSLKLTVNTADASIASTDYYQIRAYLEGIDYAELHGGTPLKLSFQTRSSVTGTYSVGLMNNAENRAYATEYLISSADTWETKEIDLTTDTTGTWATGSGARGLQVCFNLSAGSNYHASSNDTWSATDNFASSAQVNWMGTASNTFYITNVKLEVGYVATPNMYDAEIDVAECQRRFEKSYDLATAPGTVTNNGVEHFRAHTNSHIGTINYLTRKMSASGTITYYNPAVASTTGSWRDLGAATNITIATQYQGESRNSFGLTSSTDTNQMTGHWTVDCDFT